MKNHRAPRLFLKKKDKRRADEPFLASANDNRRRSERKKARKRAEE